MASFKSMKTCETFGPLARVLTGVINYTQITEFEGDALPIVPHIGRLELNEVLRARGKAHVVIIGASHCGNSAVFGKDELVSSEEAGCRAVVVLGFVGQSEAIRKARIPILAYGCTPRRAGSSQGGADRPARGCACGHPGPSAECGHDLREQVAALAEALNQPDARPEAAEALRMLIEKIVLTSGPQRGEVFATLHGELGTILEWTERQALGKTTKTTKPAAGATGLLGSLVAGARFELTTFRL